MLVDTFIDETGFCIGDFDGQSLSTDYGCSVFPVNDDDHFFTVGFGITSEILTPICPTYFPWGHTPSLLHFCSIYSDCDGGPTIGLSLSVDFLGCIAENPVVLAASSGLAAAVSTIAKAGL